MGAWVPAGVRVGTAGPRRCPGGLSPPPGSRPPFPGLRARGAWICRFAWRGFTSKELGLPVSVNGEVTGGSSAVRRGGSGGELPLPPSSGALPLSGPGLEAADSRRLRCRCGRDKFDG